MYNPMKDPTTTEGQRRLRFKLTLHAIGAEYGNGPIYTPDVHEKVAGGVNLEIDTGDEILDNLFKTHYNKEDTSWVRHHPNLNALAQIYLDCIEYLQVRMMQEEMKNFMYNNMRP